MNSAIALACSSFSPADALVVRRPYFLARLWLCARRFGLTSIVVPLSAGAFIAGLPSPLAPWQPAHFLL